MPYAAKKDLPSSLKEHLPDHAQDIYRAAYNNAWDEYEHASTRRGSESREEAAHKVAWAAVEQKYRKDEKSGDWKAK